MKILKIVLFLSLINFQGFCQNKKFNLVIFLNDELIENVYNFNLFENDSLQHQCEYTIGELKVIDSFDKYKLMENALNHIKLKFTIFEVKNNISKNYNYEVVLNKLFLERKFVVIRLYNLESKKYRKKLKKKSLWYDYNIFSNGVFKLNL